MKCKDMVCFLWTLALVLCVVAFLSWFASPAHAGEWRAVIPTWTKHTKYPDGFHLNDEIYGLAFEYKTKNLVFGAGKMDNSEFKESKVFYMGYESVEGPVHFVASLVSADGYSDLVNYKNDTDFWVRNDRLMYPLYGFRYKWFRFLTSYPFGEQLLKDQRYQTDVMHLQLVIPIE